DVAGPDISAILVLNRIWEARVQVVNWYDRKLPRGGDRAPEQKAVRRIERQAPARIWIDHRLRKIPKELIHIVEVAVSAGSDIRGIQQVLTRLKTGSHLELSIRIGASIREFENSRCPVGDRRNDNVVAGIALLIGDAQSETRKNLPVEFQIP